jgi:exodeoxyribonuclease VII small subunit
MTEQTFTQALKRLEEIVAKLEQPDVELEQGLALLEEGVQLHRFCQDKLGQTQAKITQLLAQPDKIAETPTLEEAVKPARTRVSATREEREEITVVTPSDVDPWSKIPAKPEPAPASPTSLFDKSEDDGLPF